MFQINDEELHSIFRQASRTPYLAYMWLFLRNIDDEDDVDMELRIIVATEGERVLDNNLEEKENFTKLFTSQKLEFLDKSELSVKVSGNLEAACDSLTSTRLTFRPFVENRLTIPIKRKEPQSTPVGKLEITNDCDVQIHTMPLVYKPSKQTVL